MTPEELRARTKKFATDLVQFCETLPRTPRLQELAVQLVDSATGVGSNYRAACRARSRADFVNKISVTLECADESLYWLELLIESKLADSPAARAHMSEAEQLTKILAASRNTARGRRHGGDGGRAQK